jgi:hypothetical protein
MTKQAADGAWRAALPLITDVFSAVDHLLITGHAPAPEVTPDDLRRVRVLLERAIFELLVREESSSDAPNDQGKSSELDLKRRMAVMSILPPRPPDQAAELTRTVQWLRKLPAGPNGRVTLISTNYDIEVEQELFRQLDGAVFDRVDFGMRVRDPRSGKLRSQPRLAKFAVHKLHGSLNWLRCDLCGNAYLNPDGAITYLSFLFDQDSRRGDEDHGRANKLAGMGANRCHCGHAPLRHVIVAPSFVRDVRDAMLLEIWRSAMDALREADKWIIVGYSLPPEDVAIRAMFLRAYRAHVGKAPKIVVVQHERREPELTRYGLLFPDHVYHSGGLRTYLPS